MDTVFLNSKNSKTSDPHGLLLLLNLTNIIYLHRSDKHVLLSSHSIYYVWKNVKMS